MLWKVEGGRLALLGGVHMLDVPDLPLSDAAWQAFNAAERVVFEHVLIPAVDSAVVQLPPGQSLRGIATEELFETVQKCCQQLSLNIDEIASYQPWYAGLRVAVAASVRARLLNSNGVDWKLWKETQRLRKTIEYLEDANAALQTFSVAPVDEQLMMLRMAVTDPEGIYSIRLIDCWKQRRADLLAAFMRERLSLAPVMFSSVIEGRNCNWLPRLRALAQDDQRTLAVVGALHLVGDTGLPALLRAEGYTVTPVDVSGE
jgi:uncharacterized protein YbaP (TraB family)